MKDKLLNLVKNYKFYVIVILILFTLYLIFGKPSVHTETDIQFDQVDTTSIVK